MPDPITLASLLTPSTEEEVLARMLTDLADMGFASTSWQDGQPELDIVRVCARMHASATGVISTLARYCFFGLLTDDDVEAAYEFARSWYSVEPHPATAAERSVTLRNDAGAGPYSSAAGSLVLAGGDGQEYENTSTVNIPATVGATVTATFRARVFGTAGNVATLSTFSTPLAGVSISAQSVTLPGEDGESVRDLRLRCEARWGTLAINGELPASGYEYAIKTAVPEIRRTYVDNANPRGAGTFDVYVARANAAATGGDVTDAQTRVDEILPPNADGLVVASGTATGTLAGVVLLASGTLDAAKQAEANAAGLAYINTLAIGAVLRLSELVTALSSVDGVESVALTAPLADVTLTASQIHLWTSALTFAEI